VNEAYIDSCVPLSLIDVWNVASYDRMTHMFVPDLCRSTDSVRDDPELRSQPPEKEKGTRLPTPMFAIHERGGWPPRALSGGSFDSFTSPTLKAFKRLAVRTPRR
jgi:hypothetical protein